MKTYLKSHLSLMPFFLTLLGVLLWLVFVYDGSIERLFVTADQAGYSAYKKKDYATAAKNFDNLSFKGASYFRDASFKEAKSVYQNLSSKEARYNLGNVYVMLGEYDHAIESYELALKIDPNFQQAKDNLKVAKARKILKEPENDGEQGVGELGSDEIVFDNKDNKGVKDDQSAQQETLKGNANWLDRLQTGPKAFLKNKFMYQYKMQEQQNQGGNDEDE